MAWRGGPLTPCLHESPRALPPPPTHTYAHRHPSQHKEMVKKKEKQISEKLSGLAHFLCVTHTLLLRLADGCVQASIKVKRAPFLHRLVPQNVAINANC